MTKEAWVTVVTNDTYGLGALVLGSSLRRVATTRDTVVLVTPGVSDRMREELGRLFTSVVPVDVLDSGDTANLALMSRPELGVTFTKLHAWTLVQYTKCVFLDADTLVIQNSDELFEREELSAAPDPGWPDCFNSGVFVFVPSLVTYQALLDFAIAHGSFDGGDQGLLNMFFREWATQDIKKHLPFIYNLVASTAYTYLPALKFFGNQVKIVHFLGGNKPWTKQAESSSLPYQRAWWSIFREDVSPRLTQDMIMSSSLTGSASQAGPTTPHYRFQDPWLNFKPPPESYLSQNLPDPPSRSASLGSCDKSAQNVCHINVCHDKQKTKHEQIEDLIKPIESHNFLINEENHDCFSKNNTENNCLVYNNDSNLILNAIKFKASSNSISGNHVNGFNIHTENLRSENPSQQYINNDTIIKLTEESKDSSLSKNNTNYIKNYESNIVTPETHFSKEDATKEYQTLFYQDIENNQIQNVRSEKDLTMNELDKIDIILKPTKPCFLQNESGSSKGEFNFAGVAGALARGDSEELRKEAWEAGDVDYLGRDSFDNIWRRICECVGITSISPVQPAAVIPPAGELVVKPAEQAEAAAQPTESKVVIESSTPKDAAAQPTEAPAKEIPVLPVVAAEVAATAVAATEVSTTPAPAAETPAPPAVQKETAAQPAAPAEAPAQPTPPAKKQVESTTPVESPAQPAAPAEAPAQPTPPAEKQVESTTPVEKPVESTTPVETPAQPAAPAETPAKPATPVETPAQPATPVETSAQPATPAVASEQLAVSAQPAVSAEGQSQPAVPTDTPAQPAPPVETPTQQPTGPAESLDQPTASVEKPADVPPKKVETQLDTPKDKAPQPLPIEAGSQPPAPVEVSPQSPISAEATPQPSVTTEGTSQSPAPVEVSPQTPKTAESSTAPTETPAESKPKADSVGKPSTESKPAETPADSGVKAESQPAPTESPVKPPEACPVAQAALPSETTIPPPAPVPTDSKSQPEALPHEKPAAELAPAVETKTPGEAPKCSVKPEDCCGKPETCSVKPPTSTEQGKDAVCSKPEKKSKETPKLPPTPADAALPGAAPVSSSEGAACPKEPGTPTVTPPSGAASPIAADTPEVCKLQATPSQPSTPPASGPEGSEPPVPPKRKQAKAPKGGKK